MKKYSLFLSFFLMLFTGCGSTLPPAVEKEKEPIVYKTTLECDSSLEYAQLKAVKALEKETGLAVIVTYATLEQDQKQKSFCYEYIIYKSAWSAYETSLASEHDSLLNTLSESNNTVTYSKKALMIESWIQKAHDFNKKLALSSKIVPLNVVSLDVNASQIAEHINAIPEPSIRFMGCNRGSNYQCRVTFISKVEDEENKIEYFWDFGDDVQSERKVPLHTYDKLGVYEVSLRVVDAQGAEAITSKTLHVKKSSKPIALFSTNKDAYQAGEIVIVHNKSYTQKSKIVRYQWRFGDGKLSSKEAPAHRYTKKGKYYIQLKVCNANGACAAASKRIIVVANKHSIKVKKGTLIKNYIAIYGAPSKIIKKEKSSMAAYRYGDIWLLAKRGKIRCAVHDSGLSTNLLGQPKKCDWHQKHARRHMVELKWDFIQ